MPIWLDAALVVGGLFALIALMPDFDGRNGEDWERRDPPPARLAAQGPQWPGSRVMDRTPAALELKNSRQPSRRRPGPRPVFRFVCRAGAACWARKTKNLARPSPGWSGEIFG